MDKQHVELLNLVAARCRRIVAQRNARKAAIIKPRAPQAPSMTPNEIDKHMHRRRAFEEARVERMREVMSRKKKLPLPPMLAPTDDEPPQQLRPRVVGEES